MFDPTQLKQSASWNQSHILFDVARMPDSPRLAIASSDFNIHEFDTADPAPRLVPFASGHTSYVTSVVRTERHWVSAGYDGKMIWWDTDTRTAIRSIDAHAKWIRMLTVSPDRSWIASVADDMVCRVWDAESGSLRHEFRDHEVQTPHHYPSMLYAVTVSQDGRWLATGDKVGQVIIRDLKNGETAAQLRTPLMYTWDPVKRRHSIGGIRSLAFSHDGEQIAIGGIGQIGNIDHLGGPHRIEVFRWQDAERLHEIENEEFKGLVEQLEFDPAGKWLLAAGGDHNGFVSIYDLQRGEPIWQEKAPMHVHAISFQEDRQGFHAVGHEKIACWRATAK